MKIFGMRKAKMEHNTSPPAEQVLSNTDLAYVSGGGTAQPGRPEARRVEFTVTAGNAIVEPKSHG